MVNTTCAVDGCDKESYPGCGICFHKLPSNSELRKKWMEVIPGKVTSSSVICSMHFKKEDYLTEARKKLKPGVVPSAFSELDVWICDREVLPPIAVFQFIGRDC
ncbi:jg24154 [Pararge aegeria aegeria]|uniref:Jg24154 protein n=1 Tax=Pararge aegeria aegeria TaxID=348720 RepID=A0A8S4QY22_9NEOP|nr:jg24154 [Pararge aegeria aegeria]